MITETYTVAFYRSIYDQLGLAGQDRVRYAYGQWLDRLESTDSFLTELQREASWIA
jgi:hypothetical protein